MIRWLPFWIALVVCLSGQAATYYVDYDGGSDSANGTSTGTAWKRCPGDPSATGTAGGTTLVAGDKVIFKGGVTYFGAIRINFSGSPGNPIEYDWSGSTWGTGRARASNNFDPGTSFVQAGTTGNARSNMVWHGFEFFQIGGRAYNSAAFNGVSNSLSSFPGGNAFYFDVPIYDVTISNGFFREIGSWTNTIENRAHDSVNGSGVNIRRGGARITVKDCVFTKMQKPFGLHMDTSDSLLLSDVLIENILITNSINWGIDVSASRDNSVYSNITFRSIRIGDFSEYDQRNWKADPFQNMPRHDGKSGGYDSPHTDGFFFRNNSAINVIWTNVVIDGLDFWTDLPGDPANGGGTAGIFLSKGPSVTIRNVTSANLRQPYTISVGHGNNVGPVQSVIIEHCTLFNGRIRSGTETDPAKRRLYIRNNIFVRTGTGNTTALTIEQTYQMLAQLDGNLYWSPSIAPGTWNVANLAGLDTSSKFADLQAFGFEADGAFGDPLFTNAVAPWRTTNLRVKEGSAALNMGLNLTNTVLTDRAGNSRVGQVNTVGAYVFGTAEDPGDTTPPSPDPMTWTTQPELIGQNTASMSWTEATDGGGGPVTYIVHETTGNPGCSGIVTTETTFVNDDIPLGTTCGYNVRAQDEFGNSTAASSTVFVSTPTEPFLYNVRILSATVGGLAFTTPGGPTNLFYFTAEEDGMPDGWSTNGLGFPMDWDYSSEVWRGLQSLLKPDTTNFAYTIGSFNTSTQINLIGAVRRQAVGGTPRKIGSLMLNGAEKAAWYFSTNGLDFNHGTVTNRVSLYSTNNSWYCYNISYEPGTGSNGRMLVYWGTNMVWSAAPTNLISTGTSTDGVNQIMLGLTNNLPGNRVVYDDHRGINGFDAFGDNPTVP